MPRFIRGDAKGDGIVNCRNIWSVIEYVFEREEEIGCVESADVNNDAAIDWKDPICLIKGLFLVLF